MRHSPGARELATHWRRAARQANIALNVASGAVRRGVVKAAEFTWGASAGHLAPLPDLLLVCECIVRRLIAAATVHQPDTPVHTAPIHFSESSHQCPQQWTAHFT
jgi:hypothetical protein